MNSEFLDAVKELIGTVDGFLRNDTGDDDFFIVAMGQDVDAVLYEARGIPELRKWVGDALFAGELSQTFRFIKN